MIVTLLKSNFQFYQQSVQEEEYIRLDLNHNTRIVRDETKPTETFERMNEVNQDLSPSEIIQSSRGKRESNKNKLLFRTEKLVAAGQGKSVLKSKDGMKQAVAGCINQSCLDNLKKLQFWIKGDFANAEKRFKRYETFVKITGKFSYYFITSGCKNLSLWQRTLFLWRICLKTKIIYLWNIIKAKLGVSGANT